MRGIHKHPAGFKTMQNFSSAVSNTHHRSPLSACLLGFAALCLVLFTAALGYTLTVEGHEYFVKYPYSAAISGFTCAIALVTLTRALVSACIRAVVAIIR